MVPCAPTIFHGQSAVGVWECEGKGSSPSSAGMQTSLGAVQPRWEGVGERWKCAFVFLVEGWQ